MARSFMKVPFNCTVEQAQNKVSSIMTMNGFKQTTIKTGENVWKKGTGFLTAMQFAKIEYVGQEVQIAAWVQAGLGNVGLNEMDLSGTVGAIPKKSLKKVLEKIVAAL